MSTAEKRDSQGVCFIGEFDMLDFLKKYIKPQKGKVVNLENKVVGEHNGVNFYTIGQRHGVSSGGGIPYYIVAKDAKKNLLIVADKADEEKFYKKEVEIGGVNWITGKPLGSKASKLLKARIRYRQPLQNCQIIKIKNVTNKKRSLGNGNILIRFAKPQRAVTPGQSLVLYDNKEMLGGGIIK